MSVSPDAEPAVAAAVIVDNGQLLLIRRALPERELVWQFPAGKLAPDEQPDAAAVRETREETGLDVTAVTVLGDRIHPATKRRMYYVACTVTDGQATIAAHDEITAIAWITHDQLPDYIPTPLLPAVREHLNAHMCR